MTFAISGISIPSFWLGLMLIQVFREVNFRWFPTVGVEGWRSLVLPSITLGASVAAIIARFTRSSIIGILKEDYLELPSKGLKRKIDHLETRF